MKQDNTSSRNHPMPESDQAIMLEKALEANTSTRMANLYQQITDMWNEKKAPTDCSPSLRRRIRRR